MEIGVRPDNWRARTTAMSLCASAATTSNPAVTAVVQRHAGPHDRPRPSLARGRDDMIIRHDQPTSVEDDARAHDVTVDTSNLQRDDTGQHLRRDPLHPVTRGVGHLARMGSAGRGHCFVHSDRMNQQNDGQSGHRGRHRHPEIPQQFERNPNQSLPPRGGRHRPVRRVPPGGLAMWLRGRWH